MHQRHDDDEFPLLPPLGRLDTACAVFCALVCLGVLGYLVFDLVAMALCDVWSVCYA
ncbi:hypothetical protein LMG26854_03353 [Achromobacter aegrifaciens]|uniref:hypothetical protein n=1 Tax=Achromobacter aegrifaciens TaxID=1287736 RepID=UPI0014655B32|nr:hypothetical protein [Achromobacter aegrifaciens]CAB3858689.1 hypothetical protein LMG26854_03353 [Achromobacter aegrifaciens]